ncbi:hypothetical protein LAT59_01290 [Candidatus Gracilibacteria bacterium]|nr:hypothetical protein [Candidatus Gracilibacteria bacterium]
MNSKSIVLLRIIIPLFCVPLLTGCNSGGQSGEDDIEQGTGYENIEIYNEDITWEGEDERELNDSDDVRKRIESIRKRHELRELFVNAEAYLEGGQQAMGLKTLLEVYRENPEDGLVVTKIAETYYDMKRFGSSINYYKRLSSLQEHQKQRIILLHFYTQDISTASGRENVIQELRRMRLSEEEIRYYTLSLLCIESPEKCKNRFENYISSLESISYPKLNDMRIALRNYTNFGLEDDYLLYTYIITEWYKQDLYPLVVYLGEKIIKEKENYKPALKIIGHSLFELGEYEGAKEILTRFHRLDDSDAGVNYMLGIIYAKTRDAVLANIFLKRALDIGYTPTLNLRRHIAYNFALIESRHNVLTALEDLIDKEEHFEKTDLSLAVYYHILYESHDTAIRFSQLGQERYNDDAYFYGYEGWAHREKGNPDKAIEILQKGLEEIPNNAFLYLQLAFALKETENIESMKLILETLLHLDTLPEYQEIARRELNLLR